MEDYVNKYKTNITSQRLVPWSNSLYGNYRDELQCGACFKPLIKATNPMRTSASIDSGSQCQLLHIL